jgi:hypothetical protein
MSIADTAVQEALSRRPDSGLPMLSHGATLTALAIGGLGVFAVWQWTGIEHYINALGGFCL